MKRSFILFLTVFVFFVSCSKTIEYTQSFKDQTSGKYLYNEDDIIEVYYEGNTLFLKWRGVDKIKPVALSENEFFVADMYKKFHFVQHPETKKRYLSIVDKDDETKITYDYLKVPEDYKTPSMYLNEGNYAKALEGFMEIKKRDSTSIFIEEREFNSIGYRYLRDKDYQKAIEVFRINVALHPSSDNVYDSLAEGYLLSGDSIQAYTNYKKALDLEPRNRRAKKYIDSYVEK